ncbi:MAG: hypothetical protein SFU21_04610 [Flavihumibacter sp.]|nr:hypothetical protein [Flavihumibacter sp.]
MNTTTLLAAIQIGFKVDELENDVTIEELNEAMMQFLFENSDKLPKHYEEVEVENNGRDQHVSFGDFSSTGEIVKFSNYWFEPRQKIEHSDFVHIEKDGTPINIILWCWSKPEETDTHA